MKGVWASLPSIKTVLLVAFILFAVFWNLQSHNSLVDAVGAAYVAVSVVGFTAAWVFALGYGVVWVLRLVRRGEEEERSDWVKSAQARSWVGR